MQQKGKGAPDIQKQWEMKDWQARLRLSLEKYLNLNNLNKLDDIEPLDLHWSLQDSKYWGDTDWERLREG